MAVLVNPTATVKPMVKPSHHKDSCLYGGAKVTNPVVAYTHGVTDDEAKSDDDNSIFEGLELLIKLKKRKKMNEL